MKWYKDDLNKYISAKEFIDTIIIPVQGFQLSQDSSLEKDAFQGEVLSIYANEIEKELSGRVMLLPIYTYFKNTRMENEVTRLNEWVNEVLKQPFKTVFILTLDMNWKKIEKELEGNLLWLPGMKPTDLHSSEAVQLIRNQVGEISDLIRAYW